LLASKSSSVVGPAASVCRDCTRARHLFIRQQTAVINSIRAYLAEFGIVAPVGRRPLIFRSRRSSGWRPRVDPLGAAIRLRTRSLVQSHPPASSSSRRMGADPAFDFGSRQSKNDDDPTLKDDSLMSTSGGRRVHRRERRGCRRQAEEDRHSEGKPGRAPASRAVR
jgi:hypothetical protein